MPVIKVKNNGVWEEIGGTDADTLDGMHADEFATAEHTHSEYADADHEHSNYAPYSHTHNNATTSNAGFMSSSDKIKLNNLPTEITPNGIGALPEILTSEHYGTSLPSAGTKGRIFFKKAEDV